MAYKILITENDIKNIVKKTVSKLLLKEYGAEQRLPFDDDRFKNKNYFEQYLDWLEDFGKYGKLSPSNDDFWKEIKRAVEYIIENNIGKDKGLAIFGEEPQKFFNELKYDIIKNYLSFNEDGNLYIERQIIIDGSIQQYDKSDNKRTDPKVLYNSLVQNYQNNVGGCWSYRKGRAESYCSTANGDSIVLKGYIRIEDIDFIKTALLNFYYDDEHEIRVKPKANVELFEVICNCKYKMPLKGHLIVNATYFGNNKTYKTDYAPIDDGFGNQDYMDRKGSIINKEELFKRAFSSGRSLTDFFDEVSRFGSSLYKILLNDKYYLSDNKGNITKSTINGGLNYIGDLYGDYAKVEKNEQESLIDSNGNLIGDGNFWFEEVIHEHDNVYIGDLNGKEYLIVNGIVRDNNKG